MLLKSLTKYQPANMFLYIGIGVGLWIKTILDSSIPGIYIGSDPTPVYSLIIQLIGTPGLWLLCKILALLLILFQGLFFNGIINQYNLIGTRSYLPGILYLIITANFPDTQLLHPVFIATPILILSWSLLIDADFGQNKLASYFNSAIFLGLASLIYPNYLFFIIILLASTALNRIPSIREFAMILTGIFTLVYFYFSFSYIFTDKIDFSGINYHLNFSADEFIKLKTGQIIFFIYFTFLIAFSLLQATRSMAKQKVNTRRNFKILFLWFLLGSMIFLFTNSGMELIYLLAIPISAVVSLLLTDLRNKWVREISFIFIILITLINQFLPEIIP